MSMFTQRRCMAFRGIQRRGGEGRLHDIQLTHESANILCQRLICRHIFIPFNLFSDTSDIMAAWGGALVPCAPRTATVVLCFWSERAWLLVLNFASSVSVVICVI